MTVELVLFYAFGALTVACSLAVVLARSAITSAMALVSTFFFLAGIYVLLWAHSIAVFQVLVYAGAIMVLFLFVIMLLSLGNENEPAIQVTPSRALGAVVSVALMAALTFSFMHWHGQPFTFPTHEAAMEFGTVAQLGQTLYTQYLFPFEAVSLLLLVAIVGAVVVSKSRI